MPAGSTYEPIATTTLSSTSSSVIFSGIPLTYTDLVLITNSLGTGGFFRVQINENTTALYSRVRLGGTGTTLSSTRATNSTPVTVNDLSSTVRETSILNFINYSNTTTFKTMLGRTGLPTSNTGELVVTYRNAAAITSRALNPSTANGFAIGSTFTLYGITAA